MVRQICWNFKLSVNLTGFLPHFSGLLMLVTPQNVFAADEGGTCTTMIRGDVSVTQGFFIEFLITFTLVAMVCACWNTAGGESAPLRIGLTVTTLCIASGTFTNASLNPARSFGWDPNIVFMNLFHQLLKLNIVNRKLFYYCRPALLLWEWENHWVYWVAPMLGGLAGSTFYRVLFWKKWF